MLLEDKGYDWEMFDTTVFDILFKVITWEKGEKLIYCVTMMVTVCPGSGSLPRVQVTVGKKGFVQNIV